MNKEICLKCKLEQFIEETKHKRTIPVAYFYHLFELEWKKDKLFCPCSGKIYKTDELEPFSCRYKIEQIMGENNV